MVNEICKAAALEEVDRRGLQPLGKSKILQNESKYSPYGHQEYITAELGTKARMTEEGKFFFEYFQYGYQ